MEITRYRLNCNLHIRIALLADLHGRDRPDMMGFLKKGKPDAIVIAGDLFDGRRIESVEKPLEIARGKLLINRLLGIAPVYFGLGNHEWKLTESDKEFISASGLILLDNTYVQLVSEVYIGGLTSASRYGRYRDISRKPDIAFLKRFEHQKGFRILICHHPEYYDPYLANRTFDLILSGHAHGGQIRIGNQGLYAPGQGVLPKYTSGIVDGKMIVSRGLSNTKPWIPRFFNKTELIFIDL